MVLEATGLLVKEAEPIGKMIVDVRNGFNNPIQLEILWMVQHRWPYIACSTFNCYKNWVNLIPCWPGIPPDTLLR